MAGRKGEKHWRDALMIAVNESREGNPGGRKNLRMIADKVVELAMDGDMMAIKEIGDRMDGRAAQEVIHQGDDENPVRTESAALDRLAAVLERLGPSQSG